MTQRKEKVCRHLKLLPKLPTETELTALRRGYRRRKNPTVTNGDAGTHATLGAFKIGGEGDDQVVTFKIGPARRWRTLNLSALSEDPKLTQQRLGVGWLIADMHALDAMHQRDQIGHPLEALRSTAALVRAEKNWRHWAIGPASSEQSKKPSPSVTKKAVRRTKKPSTSKSQKKAK